MIKVETSTITVLIGFAILIGGIGIGSLIYGSQETFGLIIGIISGLVGGGLIVATLFPKMFKKR